MTPDLHLLMPIYNARGTLSEVLGSLRAQTLDSWRCLLIDDGSTDGSVAIAREAARRDRRFEVVERPHAGIVAALNAGLQAVGLPPSAFERGSDTPALIARIDADDPALPTRLAAQVAHMRAHPDIDLVACQCSVFKSDGDEVGAGMLRYMGWANGVLSPEAHRLGRFIESPIAHSSVTARPWIFAAGYRPDLPWAEDYDLWLTRLAQGARFSKLPEVLMRIRDDPDRTSRHDPRCTQQAFLACKLHHLRQSRLRGVREVILWGAGRVGKRWLRALPEAGVAVPAVVDLHPRKIGKVIHGARVIAPEDLPAALSKLSDPCFLVAVGAEGAREDIRARTSALGLCEEKDYLFVA